MLDMECKTTVKDAIAVRNLTKRYKDFTLDNISFSVPVGTIMGFIGENGAGKTTTIKAILNLIHTDGGEISVLGYETKNFPPELKAQIGVVLDGSNIHDNITARDVNLIMKNIYPNWDEGCFMKYLDRFNLPENKVVKEFSRGMKMKLSISIALSHKARLLILDEPTSGLDPMVRNEILDIFLEFIQDEEHTILLSSHIISDIEKIADYVTFIHKGRIVFSESKDNLIYQYGLLHCRKEDVDKIDRAYVAGIRENSFGAEIMIRNKDEFQRKYKGYSPEKTSLEEIMLFISKGRK